MAHQNIEERRRAVKDALKEGQLSMSQRKQLAKQFNCSPSAIWSDYLTLMNGSVFHVSRNMKKRIIERDKSVCYICGNFTDNPMIEHKIPARAGGRSIESNLAVACQSCNIKKRFTDELLYPI